MKSNSENTTLAKWLIKESNESENLQLENDFDLDQIQRSVEAFDHVSLLPLDLVDSWEQLNLKRQGANVRVLHRRAWLTTIAAGFIVLLGIFFLTLPPKNQVLSFEEGNMHRLPDQSSYVFFEGPSSIFYKQRKPRSIQLQGQAYFQVSEGDRFEVNSDHGKVVVLGTSFEIRDQETYSVSCFSGKVMVMLKNGTENILLGPGEGIRLDSTGNRIQTSFESTSPEWLARLSMTNSLNFEQLTKLMELEYQITIENPSNLDRRFRGEVPFDDLPLAMEILRDALNLKITKTHEAHYVIEER